MQEAITRENFHKCLVRDVFRRRVSDSTGVLIMAVLHTFRIDFVKGTLADWPQGTNFVAITQRHAAECVATLWKGTGDERENYLHWYFLWQSKGMNELYSEYSEEEKIEIDKIKERFESDPRVLNLTPED